MSWQKRRQKSYYYSKRRVNGRYVNHYLGNSPQARAAAQADLLRAQIRAQQRAEFELEKQNIKQIENLLDEMNALLQPLIHAHMVSAGYYLHKGQWRKKHARERKHGSDARTERN
jgi:hypothetical protein